MADLSELYTLVGNVMVGDATLAALLGNAQQVYQEMPVGNPTFPAITFRITAMNPKTQLSGVGGWNPVWRIIAYGVDNDTLYAIHSRLASLLEVPKIVTSPLVGSSHKIPYMTKVDLHEAPPYASTNDGMAILTMVSIWNSLALPIS